MIHMAAVARRAAFDDLFITESVLSIMSAFPPAGNYFRRCAGTVYFTLPISITLLKLVQFAAKRRVEMPCFGTQKL